MDVFFASETCDIAGFDIFSRQLGPGVLAHTIRHHVSSESLFGRLAIESLDTYYHRRLLRWAGHVARMPLNRAPRMFLSGWVANSRPTGCPQMTWGRTLKKALQRNSLPTEFSKWRKLAADQG